MGARRLFYALWPDEPVLDGLAAVQQRHRDAGRPVPRDRLHLTVLFLGEADPRIAAAAGAAAAAWGGPLRLELDTLGYFAKSRVVWAGATACPEPLIALHRALYRELRRCGVRVGRSRLVPHVTLFRKARPVRGAITEVPEWRVDRITLVSSRREAAGPIYSMEAEWRLGRGGIPECDVE